MYIDNLLTGFYMMALIALNWLRQGSKSGSQNCGKKSRIYHFLETAQYTCNISFRSKKVKAKKI